MPDEPNDHPPGEGSVHGAPGGLTAADILEQPEPARGLLSWMAREAQVDLPAIVAFLGQDESATRSLLAALEVRSYVQQVEVEGVTFYRVQLANTRKRGRGADWLFSFQDP